MRHSQVWSRKVTKYRSFIRSITCEAVDDGSKFTIFEYTSDAAFITNSASMAVANHQYETADGHKAVYEASANLFSVNALERAFRPVGHFTPG